MINNVMLYLAMLMLKRDRCNERQFFFRLGHLSFLNVHDVHYRLHAHCYLYSVACNNMSMNGRSVSVAIKHQLLMRILWDNCAINQSFSLSHEEITSDKRGLPEGRRGYLKNSPTGPLPSMTIQACTFIPMWPNFFSIWAILNTDNAAKLFVKFCNLCKMKHCIMKTGKKCFSCSTIWRSQ